MSPARSPERNSSLPIRQEDHRLERPTNMIKKAAAMSKGSKAVNNGLTPPAFSFFGELPDIKRESTGKQDQHQEQIYGASNKDGWVFVKICLWVDVSQ